MHHGQGAGIIRACTGQHAFGHFAVGGSDILLAVLIRFSGGEFHGLVELRLRQVVLASLAKHLAHAGMIQREGGINLDATLIAGSGAIATVIGIVVLPEIEPVNPAGGRCRNELLEGAGGALELLFVRELHGIGRLGGCAKCQAGGTEEKEGLHACSCYSWTIWMSRGGTLMGATPSFRMIRCPLWFATKETNPVPRPLFPSVSTMLTVRLRG